MKRKTELGTTELDLNVYDVDDRDLRRIAALPRLKSLKLVNPAVTREGLAELGALKSLEELAIHDQSDDIISAAGLESLIKVMHLKKLHLDRYVSSKIGSDSIYKVTLDNGGEIAVPASEADAFLRALKALREAKPGILIDNRDYSEDLGAEEKIPWYDESDSDYLRNLPQLPLGAFPQTIPGDGFRSLKW